MHIFVLFIICSACIVESKIAEIKNGFQSLVLRTINETAPDFEPCNENLVKKAVFGDLIEIKRPDRGYFHWSVYVRNATVIQLDNPEFNKLTLENAFDNFTGQVELRNLFELAGTDFCRINNKMSESRRKGLHALSNAEILKKMKEGLERNVTWYNIFDYNCESFATNLKFGVMFSSQVR